MQFGCISVPGTAAFTASTCHKRISLRRANVPGLRGSAPWPCPLALSFHWYDFVGLLQWRMSDWIRHAFLVHHPPILVSIKAFLLLKLFGGLQNG